MIQTSIELEYVGDPANVGAEERHVIAQLIHAGIRPDRPQEVLSSSSHRSEDTLTINLNTNTDSPVRANEITVDTLRAIGFRFDGRQGTYRDWVLQPETEILGIAKTWDDASGLKTKLYRVVPERSEVFSLGHEWLGEVLGGLGF